MIITDIYVNAYGTLKDKTLSLTSSVNVIEGENESGKSTLMAFILFMLYGGADDIERIKITDGKCGGTMTLSTERHGTLQIQRYASVSGKRYTDTVNVYLMPSMKKLEIKGTVGEYVLGINKQFFSTTAFVAQKGASDYSSKNVNDSIQNILLSASENYNTDKALKKLDETRKFFALKRGRGGVISELEDKISGYTSDMDINSGKISLAKEKNLEISSLKEKKKKYEELLSEIFIEKKARTSKKISDAKKELSKKEEQLKEKNEELLLLSRECAEFSRNNTRTKMRELDLRLKYDDAKILDIETDISRTSVSDEISTEHFANSAETVTESVSRMRKSIKNLKFTSLLLAVTALAALVFTILLAVNLKIAAATVCAVILLSSACTALSLLSAKDKTQKSLESLLKTYGYSSDISISEIRADFAKKAAQKLENERKIAFVAEKRALLAEITKRRDENVSQLKKEIASVLGKENVTDLDDSVQKAEEHINSRFIKSEALKGETQRLSEEISKLNIFLESEKCDFKNEAQLNPRFAEYSDTELDSGMKKANTEINLLTEQIHSKEKALSVLQSSIQPPESFETLIKETSETLKTRREQLEIVRLSDEAVRFASENIRCAVTPQLIAQSDKLFSLITDSKYSGIGITDDLSPNTVNGSEVMKKSELSYGTNEAMYLSFRSALLLILCKNELPPMMLDESFAHIDNRRTLESIRLITESGLQSLIFTCNDREKRILEDDSRNFSYVRL